MVVQRRKRRSDKQLLLRRALKKVRPSNPYLNPCNATDRLVLHDVSTSRGPIPLQSRDLPLGPNMQHSLSNDSWSCKQGASRKTMRIASTRPDKRIQNLLKYASSKAGELRKKGGITTPLKLASRNHKINVDRSGHSLKPRERSRASSSGYPSSWNLAQSKEAHTFDNHSDVNSLHEAINCIVVNRTVCDQQLNSLQVSQPNSVDNAVQCSLRCQTSLDVGEKTVHKSHCVATTQTHTETSSQSHKPYKLKQKLITNSLRYGPLSGRMLPSMVQMDGILEESVHLRPRSYSGKSETHSYSLVQQSSNLYDCTCPRVDNKSGKSKKYRSINNGGYTPSDLSVNEAVSCECNPPIGSPADKYNNIANISRPPSSAQILQSSSCSSSSESDDASNCGQVDCQANQSQSKADHGWQLKLANENEFRYYQAKASRDVCKVACPVGCPVACSGSKGKVYAEAKERYEQNNINVGNKQRLSKGTVKEAGTKHKLPQSSASKKNVEFSKTRQRSHSSLHTNQSISQTQLKRASKTSLKRPQNGNTNTNKMEFDREYCRTQCPRCVNAKVQTKRNTIVTANKKKVAPTRATAVLSTTPVQRSRATVLPALSAKGSTVSVAATQPACKCSNPRCHKKRANAKKNVCRRESCALKCVPCHKPMQQSQSVTSVNEPSSLYSYHSEQKNATNFEVCQAPCAATGRMKLQCHCKCPNCGIELTEVAIECPKYNGRKSEPFRYSPMQQSEYAPTHVSKSATNMIDSPTKRAIDVEPKDLVIDDKCNVNQIIEILHDTVVGLERQKRLLSQASANYGNSALNSTNQTPNSENSRVCQCSQDALNSEQSDSSSSSNRKEVFANNPCHCCSGGDLNKPDRFKCKKNPRGSRKSSGCAHPCPNLPRCDIRRRIHHHIKRRFSFVDALNMGIKVRKSCQLNNLKPCPRKSPFDENYFLVEKRRKYMENENCNSYERNILEGYQLQKKLEMARNLNCACPPDDCSAHIAKKSCQDVQDLTKGEQRRHAGEQQKKYEQEFVCKSHSFGSTECGLAYCSEYPRISQNYTIRDSHDTESKYSSEILVSRHVKRIKLTRPSRLSFSIRSRPGSFLVCSSHHNRGTKESKSKQFFRKLTRMNRKEKQTSRVSESMRSLKKRLFPWKRRDEKQYELQKTSSKISQTSYRDRDLKRYKRSLKSKSSLFKIEKKRRKAIPTRDSNYLNLQISRNSLHISENPRQPAHSRETRRTKSITFISKSNLSLTKGQKVEGRNGNQSKPSGLENGSVYCKPNCTNLRKRNSNELASKSYSKFKVVDSKSLLTFCKKEKRRESSGSNISLTSCKKSKGAVATSLERESVCSTIKTSISNYSKKMNPCEGNLLNLSLSKSSKTSKNDKEHKKSSGRLFSCFSRTRKEKKEQATIPEQKTSVDRSKSRFSGFFCRNKSTRKDNVQESVQRAENVESKSSELSSHKYRMHRQRVLQDQNRDSDVKVLFDSSYKFKSCANNDTDSDCADAETKSKKLKRLKTLRSASGNHFYSMVTADNKL